MKTKSTILALHFALALLALPQVVSVYAQSCGPQTTTSTQISLPNFSKALLKSDKEFTIDLSNREVLFYKKSNPHALCTFLGYHAHADGKIQYAQLDGLFKKEKMIMVYENGSSVILGQTHRNYITSISCRKLSGKAKKIHKKSVAISQGDIIPEFLETDLQRDIYTQIKNKKITISKSQISLFTRPIHLEMIKSYLSFLTDDTDSNPSFVFEVITKLTTQEQHAGLIELLKHNHESEVSMLHLFNNSHQIKALKLLLKNDYKLQVQLGFVAKFNSDLHLQILNSFFDKKIMVPFREIAKLNHPIQLEILKKLLDNLQPTPQFSIEKEILGLNFINNEFQLEAVNILLTSGKKWDFHAIKYINSQDHVKMLKIYLDNGYHLNQDPALIDLSSLALLTTPLHFKVFELTVNNKLNLNFQEIVEYQNEFQFQALDHFIKFSLSKNINLSERSFDKEYSPLNVNGRISLDNFKAQYK